LRTSTDAGFADVFQLKPVAGRLITLDELKRCPIENTARSHRGRGEALARAVRARGQEQPVIAPWKKAMAVSPGFPRGHLILERKPDLSLRLQDRFCGALSRRIYLSSLRGRQAGRRENSLQPGHYLGPTGSNAPWQSTVQLTPGCTAKWRARVWGRRVPHEVVLSKRGGPGGRQPLKTGPASTSFPAHFTGKVDDKTMTLTMTVENVTETHTLTLGQEPGQPLPGCR
jgi:hypothetical protein